jgi:hypothetical protein
MGNSKNQFLSKIGEHWREKWMVAVGGASVCLLEKVGVKVKTY